MKLLSTDYTDLPTTGKGKSGDPGKKSGDCTKNSEILFFPRSNPFFHGLFKCYLPRWTYKDFWETQPGNLGDAWELDTNPIPTILSFQNGGQTWRKTLTYWTQAKITARYKKVVSTVQKLNLLHFRKIFPKNREIGSLVVRPWEMTKNRETRQKRESWQVWITATLVWLVMA